MKPIIRTLHSFLIDISAQDPNKILLASAGCRLSAAEVLDRVGSTAAILTGMGIAAGDYVAVRTRRTVRTALTLLALPLIGAVAVRLDPRCEPEAFLGELDATIPVRICIDPEQLPDTICPPPPLPEADPKAPAFLIFTSGSTGKPKAVMLSQYNLVNNLIDSRPLGCYAPDDIALGALPMDHIFGLALLAGVCVLGYSVFFPERTDVPTLLRTIRDERITRMNGVPSLYLAMADQAEGCDLGSLRAGFIGGSPCTKEQFALIEDALGMTLIPVYGMSECIGIACGNGHDPRRRRCSCVGPFYSMNTGKILREDGTEAAPGETGEICVTGPARMLGYYPDLMPPEELLRTGDLGYLDEAGNLHLTGRKKDIIIRNGYNLSARHIEEAILSVPGVREVCVVGLPHRVQGEIPCAMVTGERTAKELFAALSRLLPKNQIPAEIRVCEALPMTPSGKPDRQKIREVLKKWTA